MPEPGAGRRRGKASRFVVIFVVLTLGLLIGYHLAADSDANARYLTVVARHTAWALGQIGDRARMSQTDRGPRVTFVLEPNAALRVEDARDALAALVAARAPQREIAAAEDAVRRLEAERRQMQEREATGAAQDGKSFSFIIVPECGAIEVMVIFLAGVVAFPAGIGARLLGLGVGLPLLYCLNVLRLACLGVIGAVDDEGQWFEFCHRYVWQSVYIIFVVIVWIAWVEFVVKRGGRPRAGRVSRQAEDRSGDAPVEVSDGQ